MKVNSYDEWSPLREVVVGSPSGYQFHELELSFRLFFHDVAHSSFYYPSVSPDPRADSCRRELNRGYVEELAEDVEELADALKMAGVVVYRPESLDGPVRFATPNWQSAMIPALNVRDQTIILGDEIVETACQVRARYFENDLLKPVFSRYFRDGSRWTSMPRPRMRDDSFDTSYVSGRDTPAIEAVDCNGAVGTHDDFEIMIDGAQCMRLGKDVIVNVATANHVLGAKWLAAHLRDRFRVHVMDRFADNHIDSLVLPLRPGLLLVRNPDVANRLPLPLQGWDYICAPEPLAHSFPTYENDDLIISSPYIDMNVLSLDEHTVIVNSLFPELISELERRRFTVIPVRHRHRRLFGGGFHCFTIDTVRDGECEDYFGNAKWAMP